MNTIQIDREVIENYYGDVKSDIACVFSEYLDGYPGMINSFTEAYSTGIDSLRGCVHLHAPAFSYIGFPHLTAECRIFEEECAVSTSVEDVLTGYNKLMEKINETAAILKQEMQNMNMKLAS